jgi:hypothetical protein
VTGRSGSGARSWKNNFSSAINLCSGVLFPVGIENINVVMYNNNLSVSVLTFAHTSIFLNARTF